MSCARRSRRRAAGASRDDGPGAVRRRGGDHRGGRAPHPADPRAGRDPDARLLLLARPRRRPRGPRGPAAGARGPRHARRRATSSRSSRGRGPATARRGTLRGPPADHRGRLRDAHATTRTTCELPARARVRHVRDRRRADRPPARVRRHAAAGGARRARSPGAAREMLREAVRLGVDLIDTAHDLRPLGGVHRRRAAPVSRRAGDRHEGRAAPRRAPRRAPRAPAGRLRGEPATAAGRHDRPLAAAPDRSRTSRSRSSSARSASCATRARSASSASRRCRSTSCGEPAS